MNYVRAPRFSKIGTLELRRAASFSFREGSMPKCIAWGVYFPLFLLAGGAFAAELEIRVIDAETGKPIAARMHLFDAKGKPVKPPGVVYWKDHFVFPGKTVLKLPNGKYTFELEHGPEYRMRTGNFTIDKGAADNKEVDL